MGSFWQYRGDGGLTSRVIPPSTTVFSSSTCFLTTLPFTSTFTASHISRFSPRTKSINEHTTNSNNYYKRTICDPSFSSNYRIHAPDKLTTAAVDMRSPRFTKTTNLTQLNLSGTGIPNNTNVTQPNLRMNLFDSSKDSLSRSVNQEYRPNMYKFNNIRKPFETLSNPDHRKVQTSMCDRNMNETSFQRSKYCIQAEKQVRNSISPITDLYETGLTKTASFNQYKKESSPGLLGSLSYGTPVKCYEDIYKNRTEIADKYFDNLKKDKNLLSSNTDKKNINKPLFRDQKVAYYETKHLHTNHLDTEQTVNFKHQTEDNKRLESSNEVYTTKHISEQKHCLNNVVHDTEKNLNVKKDTLLETDIDYQKTKLSNEYNDHSIKPKSSQEASKNYYKRYIEQVENYTTSKNSTYISSKNKETNSNTLFSNNVAEKVGKFENYNSETKINRSVSWKKHYNSERRKWQNKERFANATIPSKHCPTHTTFGKDPKRYLSANLSTATYTKRQGEETSENMLKETQNSLTQSKDSHQNSDNTLPGIQRRYTPREMKMARSIFKTISDTHREERSSKLIGYGKPRIERPVMLGHF